MYLSISQGNFYKVNGLSRNTSILMFLVKRYALGNGVFRGTVACNIIANTEYRILQDAMGILKRGK